MPQILPHAGTASVIDPPQRDMPADVTMSRRSTVTVGGATPPLEDASFEAYRVPMYGGMAPMAGGGLGTPGSWDAREVDPGYGLFVTRAHFMGQGYYDHTPDRFNVEVGGQGTPNVHPTYLRQGILTQLSSYVPDRMSVAANYVGALAPQVIPTT